MIKLILIILLGVFYILTLSPQDKQQQAQAEIRHVSAQLQQQVNQGLADAITHQRSNVQVEGQGTVSRILKDDTDGHRHQRFILQLAHGATVLVAHNIELAPRIDDLQVGDTVAFYGEYEWNPKGGVLHWTHHDPRHTHTDGWLKHHGRTYQ